MRALVNAAVDRSLVAAASTAAAAFHPTRSPDIGRRPCAASIRWPASWASGRSRSRTSQTRLGLPAFKILGASWATEVALSERPGVTTLVAASAGNHGRVVARVARLRGLQCRVFLPARSSDARREAIAAEGAEVVVVDGSYEDAVVLAEAASNSAGTRLIADVGEAGTAASVIDGYATLFDEAASQGGFDLLLVPVGVGSLAAAAARFGARENVPVIEVEPVTAACLTASLAAGRPTVVPTPGTSMAGLDCAEVSPAAWPSLLHGISGTVTVDDNEVAGAVAELAADGLQIGDSGAAPLAALRRLVTDAACESLRAAVGLDRGTRALLVATEGRT